MRFPFRRHHFLLLESHPLKNGAFALTLDNYKTGFYILQKEIYMIKEYLVGNQFFSVSIILL
jgi:hypothetical protein